MGKTQGERGNQEATFVMVWASSEYAVQVGRVETDGADVDKSLGMQKVVSNNPSRWKHQKTLNDDSR